MFDVTSFFLSMAESILSLTTYLAPILMPPHCLQDKIHLSQNDIHKTLNNQSHPVHVKKIPAQISKDLLSLNDGGIEPHNFLPKI